MHFPTLETWIERLPREWCYMLPVTGKCEINLLTGIKSGTIGKIKLSTRKFKMKSFLHFSDIIRHFNRKHMSLPAQTWFSYHWHHYDDSRATFIFNFVKIFETWKNRQWSSPRSNLPLPKFHQLRFSLLMWKHNIEA